MFDCGYPLCEPGFRHAAMPQPIVSNSFQPPKCLCHWCRVREGYSLGASPHFNWAHLDMSNPWHVLLKRIPTHNSLTPQHFLWKIKMSCFEYLSSKCFNHVNPTHSTAICHITLQGFRSPLSPNSIFLCSLAASQHEQLLHHNTCTLLGPLRILGPFLRFLRWSRVPLKISALGDWNSECLPIPAYGLVWMGQAILNPPVEWYKKNLS